MEFGIINLSIVPVRAEPSDKSEMVSQLLFGELIAVVQHKGNWSSIRNVYDNYEGWVDSKQIQIIDEAEFNRMNKHNPCYTNDLVEVVHDLDTFEVIPVVMGSVIRNLENDIFSIAGKR